MSYKKEKFEELIRSIAADFVERESNRTSLITITGAEISKDKKIARVLFSVLPEKGERAALDFLGRKEGLCRDYILKHSRIGRAPKIIFTLDEGERNRQRIDFLSQND
jgi:ribosome-binding factor A